MNLFGKPLGAMLLAGVAILGGVGSASAGSLTQTFTHASSAVPYTYDFSANQFNPIQGTLTSVVITVTSNIIPTVSVFSTSSTPEAFTNATASVPVTLSGPASLTLSVTATSAGISGTANPGTNNFAGSPVTASVGTTLSSGFGDYVGTGVNNLSFTFGAGDGTYSGSGDSSLFFGGSAAADATITITYNFTALAVPEPSSIVLLGSSGVFGLFGWRTFRRRTA